MKVSILIPCYNSEKYIARCLNSCLAQTYKDIEIIIVNDGSTDNSEKIIKSYLKKNKNIRYTKQENMGLSKTRNILIDMVETEMFFFLDSDDWIDEDAIETYVKYSNGVNLVINSCYINRNEEKSKPFYISNKINENTNIDSYLIQNTPFAWGILYRTSFIKQNNIQFNGYFSFFEDAGLMTYLIYKSEKVTFINLPKYHYWVGDKKSLSRSKMTKEKIIMSILQLNNLYSLFRENYNFKNSFPKCINDQIAFYHCIVFTYIQFQSICSRKEKKELKINLKKLENKRYKLKFPTRYWKWWYFLLYRLFLY